LRHLLLADAMQRELAFVEAVLAPALGCCCRLAISEAQPVQLPLHILQQQQQQQESWKLQPGAMALLLPDVTLLDAGECIVPLVVQLPWSAVSRFFLLQLCRWHRLMNLLCVAAAGCGYVWRRMRMSLL
jgi:hypothetical protein